MTVLKTHVRITENIIIVPKIIRFMDAQISLKMFLKQ